MVTAAIENDISDLLFLVVIGYVLAFILAFAIGANDVANSFGTSIGAGQLTLKQAFVLASICETCGAVLIGFKVSDTLRKDILDVKFYEGSEKLLMIGCISALSSSSVWMLLSTYYKMPVSSTHSLVGAMLGFSLVGGGVQSMNWFKMAEVIGWWFVSPLMSGGASVILFMLVRHYILYAHDPLKTGLKLLPAVYGLTIFINLICVVFEAPDLMGLSQISAWQRILLCAVSSVFVGLITYIAVVPLQKRNIILHLQDHAGRGEVGSSSRAETMESALRGAMDSVEVEAGLDASSTTESLMSIDLIGESEEISMLFSSLQVLTAISFSFAHGGNDVSNAIGPLVALQMIYSEGTSLQEKETPLWLLFYGGVGISVGLWVWGGRVIETIGTDITKITTTGGFSIEVGAATIVLLASKLGMPISTTHCKVGSIVLVSIVRSKGKRKTVADDAEQNNKHERAAVNWALLLNILYAWIVTIPVTASLSALIMYVLCGVMQ